MYSNIRLKNYFLLIGLFCSAPLFSTNISSIIAATRNCENFELHSSFIQKIFIENRCKRDYLDCSEIQQIVVEQKSDSILFYLLLGDCQLYGLNQDPSAAYQNQLKAFTLSQQLNLPIAANEALNKLISFNLFSGKRTKETQQLILQQKELAYDLEENLRNEFFRLRLQALRNDINSANKNTSKEEWFSLLKKINLRFPKLQSDIESFFALELERSGDFKQSKEMLLAAIVSAERVNKDYFELTKFGSLANTGYQYLINNSPEKALQYFKQAANVPQTMNSNQNSSLLYSWIANAFKELNQTDSAYHYLNISNEFTTNAQTKLQEIKLKEIHSKYDNEKLTSDLVVEKQKRQLAYTWLGITIFLGLSLLLFFRNQVLQKKAALQEIEKNKLSAKLEQHDALQNERNRIAAEMHDDLGGGLTSIKYLSQKALQSNNSNKSEEQLEKILNHSQQLVANMSEIIWAMNTGYDNLENLVGYIRRFALEYFTEHDIELSFNAINPSSDYNISGTNRRNIFLIVKEALHNIVKHAQASKVEVLIELKEDLTLRIRDNGIGMQSASGGNGLKNIKRRLQQINGELKILSLNPGTELHIRLTNKAQDNLQIF